MRLIPWPGGVRKTLTDRSDADEDATDGVATDGPADEDEEDESDSSITASSTSVLWMRSSSVVNV